MSTDTATQHRSSHNVSHHVNVQPRRMPAELLSALAARFGAQFSTAMAVRQHHGRDESPFPITPPEAVCCFDSLGDAVDTVIRTIQMGVPVARSEYLCPETLRVINAYSKTALREAHSLFFEFHGTTAGVREQAEMVQAEMVQAIAEEHRGQGFEWATQPEDRTRLWKARHTALYAGLASRPGCRAIITDTCVPISRLAEQLNAETVQLALSLEGTCTGEHGIGLHKMGFLRQEAGDKGVMLMRRIKQALDPYDIFNPGKIFL